MFTNKPIVESLQKKSDSVVSVFTKTVTDLSAINEEADKKLQANVVSISALQNENEEITKVVASNQKFVDKIKSFLSTED